MPRAAVPPSPPRASARRWAAALLVGAALAGGCGEDPELVELRARNDSLSGQLEALTALNDSLAETLRRTASENERLAADVKFWQAQSEGWRVIAEGGPPGATQRRR